MAFMEGKQLTLRDATFLSLLIGVAYAPFMLGLPFIDGSTSFWQHARLENLDAMASVPALRAWLAAPWNWPLLNLPGQGAPGGINVLYADVVPGLALSMKAVGLHGNPYGWWTAACIVLNAICFTRAGWWCGVKNIVPVLLLAVVAATMPFMFTWDTLMMTLVAQWMIAIGFEAYGRRRAGFPSALLEASVPVVGVLVHPYLCVMAVLPVACGVVQSLVANLRGMTGGVRWRLCRDMMHRCMPWPLACGCIFAAITLVALGAYPQTWPSLPQPPHIWVEYPANLLELAWPRASTLLPLPPPMPATYGQAAEGFLWAGLGGGILMVIGVCTAWQRRRDIWCKDGVLFTGLLCCVAYAMTTRLTLGPFVLLDFYPEPFAPLLEMFRAALRFMWPPVWACIITGVLALQMESMSARVRHRRVATRTCIALILVQLIDTHAARQSFAHAVRDDVPAAFDHGSLMGFMRTSVRVEVWPHSDCAGSLDAVLLSLEATNLATRAGVPVSSLRTARVKLDCTVDRASAWNTYLPPNVLRIFSVTPRPPGLPINLPWSDMPSWAGLSSMCHDVPVHTGRMLACMAPQVPTE